MIFEKLKRRSGTVLVSIVLGIGMADVGLAAPAAAVHVEVPQWQLATGQECPQVPEFNFSADKTDFMAQ